MEPACPVLIYDDLCYSCTKLAKLANLLVGGKALIVGHYSNAGKQIKQQLFPEGYDGLEMSWFVVDGHAYGGRAGLVKLIGYIFSTKPNLVMRYEFNLTSCSTDCATVKGVFFRSCSILTRHRKFRVPAKTPRL